MGDWEASGSGISDHSLGEVWPTWKLSSPSGLDLTLTSSSHRRQLPAGQHTGPTGLSHCLLLRRLL